MPPAGYGQCFRGKVMTQSMPLASDLLGAPAKRAQIHLDNIFRPLAKRLQDDHMSALGIANTMRLARDYNWIKYRRQHAWRNRLYREQFEALLAENGGLTRPRIELNRRLCHRHVDVLPASRSHPRRLGRDHRGALRRGAAPISQFLPEHLDRGICAPIPGLPRFRHVERHHGAGGRHAAEAFRSCRRRRRRGFASVESSEAFDTDPTRPKDSQLYHIDPYSLPNLYVIVLLRDTTHEHGPLTFLPRSISNGRRRNSAIGAAACPTACPMRRFIPWSTARR